MTRINCVPVEELHNKHLLAEYRELPRVFTLAHNAADRGYTQEQNTYVLGTGHVKFFYTRLAYLMKRHIDLCNEMILRGFAVNIKNVHSKWIAKLSNNKYYYLWHDWEPTKNDLALNRQRINERLKQMKGVK